MGAAQHVVVGGDHQAIGQTGFGFFFVEVIQTRQPLYIGYFEVIDAMLDFLAQEHVAVGVAAVPINVPDGVDALYVHGDTFQAIGQLDGDGVQVEAAELLEIGVLGDLLAVEPHLPAQPPGAEGGALPVVLDEADVVLLTFEAQGVQAVEIQLLGVARIGLEDDLELGVHLHTVGVVAIATVVGTE